MSPKRHIGKGSVQWLKSSCEGYGTMKAHRGEAVDQDHRGSLSDIDTKKNG
jgi:hypothetical protein